MTTEPHGHTPAGTDGRAPGECPFCDIVAGRAAAQVVRRWPDSLAIVPLSGVTPGHLLVIPKAHVADVGVDPVVSAVVMRRAAELAAEFDACNIITSRGENATQTVFHLHLHVLPRRDKDGLALPWAPGRDRADGVTPEQAESPSNDESDVFQPSFIG